MQKPFIISLLLLFYSNIYAQWSSNTAINTPVCTVTGKQVDTRMADDGQGGTFIAWKDFRNGLPDIYVQHIDSLGYPVWAVDGVALCTDPADQSTPAIVSDMAGGVIVAWSDWRSGIERDLYAQRIDASGNVLWQVNGAIVTNKSVREHNEKIISDGMGGAIITWEQQQGVWDIWAQRLNSNGAAVWQNGGIPLFNNPANRLNPKIQSDGKGGGIIVCQDSRNGVDYDIYAQRVSPNGTLRWGNTGLLVCGATGAQINAKIDPDSVSGGVFVSWLDKRAGAENDLYCQRLDSAGNNLWLTNGVVVCNAPGNQSAADLLANPKVGGCIFVWKDDRDGDEDIYAQKLNLAGIRQWSINGLPICKLPASQVNPNITGDGNGGAIVCWQDMRNGDWDVYGQHIGKGDTLWWDYNGTPISTAVGEQSSPKNISDKKGGSVFAWQDQRNGTADIYCHRIFNGGGNVSIAKNDFIAEISTYPNPCKNEITLSYTLLQNENISIKLLDALGREVSEIVPENTTQCAGKHMHTIAMQKVNAGIYSLVICGTKSYKTLALVKI